jgi:hypothetical protein
MKTGIACMALALLVSSSGMAATAKKPAKKAKKAVVYVDYSKPGASGGAYGDESKGCGGAFEVKGGKGVLSVKECRDGWGGGLTMNKADAAFNASGATSLTIKVKAPKGLKFNLNINENGAGPKDHASFAGPGGADGEQYSSPEMAGAGKVKEYTVKLADFKVSEGYGNQNGNKRIDFGDIASIQLYVYAGQAAATVEVAKVTLK